MNFPIEIEDLVHRYGNRTIYDGLSLKLAKGKVYGLLGKNGVGKTTLIRILMGFLRPVGGTCRVLGDPSHALTPATRRKVGLLFEGHLAYDFLTIEQIERFHARFYPRWKSDLFWDMAGRLRLPANHRISRMSEGQRSQVVLGLLMAQDPELLILDDYSMGLDAGYRRLFLDYMAEYLKDGERTVLVTSHVIQDMESFVDEVVFLERGGQTLSTSLAEFMDRFSLYRLPRDAASPPPRPGGVIKNVEEHAGYWDVFSFARSAETEAALRAQGVAAAGLRRAAMSLEDAFIGYTGRR